MPRGQKRSITFSEYEAARKARLPILAYLLDDRARWPARLIDRADASKRLADFRSDLKNRHIVSYFTRVEELAAMVGADLGRHLSQDRQRVTRLRTPSGESRAREQRLLDALRTGDRAKRERAASALKFLLSAASVPTLGQSMLGPDEELADTAVKALQWNVAVGEGLLSPHAEVRYWAAFRIGENALQNHEQGLEHVTALVKLLARKSDPSASCSRPPTRLPRSAAAPP